MNRPSRRELLKSGVVGLGLLTAGEGLLGAAHTALSQSFHFDHVVGTSLDVWLVGVRSADVPLAEQVVLDEIERLRSIFSVFDPDSELSRLNRSSGAVPASPDLLTVLKEYEAWQRRSQGACSAQLGALVAAWQEAEKADAEPDPETLAQIVRQVREPGWVLDEARRTVTHTSSQPLNLNSVAKGYIIARAGAALRARVKLSGLLFDLGGDLLAWGQGPTGLTGWTVGVQDPQQPADNAPLLTELHLHNMAVATSGGYQRYVTINGRSFSHLLDPRTGRPACGLASATVVARDNVTANVLATTLCVLSPDEGLQLVSRTPGVECLLVTAAGEQVRSPGFASLEVPLLAEGSAVSTELADAKTESWPDGYQVRINLELPRPMVFGGKSARRPYVAVWVEDSDGKALRTLAVWGNNPKYLRDLTNWWKFAQNDRDLQRAVTKATRAPGRYQLVWDGKDAQGKPVAQGSYTIRIETHREHGKHTVQTGAIDCLAEDAKATLEKNAEIEATLVEYRGKK